MRLILALALCLATGCVKSTDTKTENIQAIFSAVATESGTTVCRAKLSYRKDGVTTSLDLTSPDKLVVVANGKTVEMKRPLLGGDEFEATLDGNASGTPIEFTLKRAENVSVTSRVTLPGAFSIPTSIPDTVSVSSDSVSVSATPAAASGERTTWSASGPCVNSINEASADATGAYIPGGTISTIASDEGQSCTLTLTLYRTKSATPASELAPTSELSATQSRSIEFNVGP